MARRPAKHGTEWTNNDIQRLRKEAGKGTDTPVIAKKLQRTIDAVYQEASKESISLKPKDK